jgi:hypothetical protein
MLLIAPEIHELESRDADTRFGSSAFLRITWFTSERSNPSERSTLTKYNPSLTYTTMPSQRNAQPSYTENILQLAI